ncbi:hypothetical protein QJS04_geneDACA020240 [Acorus gramineus]|uniref:Uncharacterized protein n=1 Tax=Acorus gramineus TaxID=55184 RepID=A0AAV9A4G7_ACOGR|nr:hypothetical protein QJS04_geneDACA020240 [Acorus gramineus]
MFSRYQRKMVVISSSFSLLMLLLLSLLSHPVLAFRRLRGDVEVGVGGRSNIPLENQFLRDRDHLRRVKHHEVHSGPNPISNAFPSKVFNGSLRATP